MKNNRTIEEEIIYKLIESKSKSRANFVKIVGEVYSAHKKTGYHRNIDLRDTYDKMVFAGVIPVDEKVEKLLITKKMRSLSGVSIITVLTKPYECPGKCIYCPSEKDVPKSYLSNEPAVMRAILNQYDPRKQVQTRLDSLAKQGHPIDKIEIIVIGGTFSYLPKDYQEEYIKGCFDALNGFESPNLAEAKLANEKAKSRCVGLTLETRPDYINEKEVAWFRYLGATRVEMGVQSIFDDVLQKNARGHDVAETIRATKLLKNAGFKINYHLMPNLYGSNLDRDREMFHQVFTNSDFKPDYIKIYPCMVMAGTGLSELYHKGEYQPYTDNELIELIAAAKKEVPYWIRIMRTIRDIPAQSIEAGSKTSNLRQIILENAKKEGWQCNCIRCREAGISLSRHSRLSDRPAGGDPKSSDTNCKLFTEEYEASEGKELFLSFESTDREVLYSLLRLRFPVQKNVSSLATNQGFTLKEKEDSWPQTRNDEGSNYDLYKHLPELKGSALIREVHTYGQQVEIGESPSDLAGKGETQHKGLGRKLIEKAEELAKEAGYKKIAVISGVGVRDYYRKFGYERVGEYMIKAL